MQDLNTARKLSFAVGHFLCDVGGCLYVTFILIYLQLVNRVSPLSVGIIFMAGQIADAATTVASSHFITTRKIFSCYGGRKTWHLIGGIFTLAILVIFSRANSSWESTDGAHLLFYVPCIVLFQFGWTSSQLSHFSLLSDVSESERERAALNGIRYAFSVMAYMLVYCLSIFYFYQKSSAGESIAEDRGIIERIVIITTTFAVGMFFVFHLGARESQSSPTNFNYHGLYRWSSYMFSHKKILYGILYVISRVVANVTLVYLPFYVLEHLDRTKYYIVLVPLVSFISGFVISSCQHSLNSLMGIKNSFAFGLVCSFVCAIFLYVISPSDFYFVFIMAVISGFGTVTMIVASRAMMEIVTGNNSAAGNVVYGSVSFAEKMLTGLAILSLQIAIHCLGNGGVCVKYGLIVVNTVFPFISTVGMLISLSPKFELMAEEIDAPPTESTSLHPTIRGSIMRQYNFSDSYQRK